MRFNDKKYVEEVKKFGRYPKIHDDIFSLSRFIEVDNVVDLGCCTGLLSHRLSNIYKFVIGIEANKNYLCSAIPKDNIKYINLKIDFNTLEELKEILKENSIECVFARRVIPEIFDTNGVKLVSELVEVLFKSGVKFIVIEGRKKVVNPKNLFSGINKEIEIFNKYYKTFKKYKNCCILKAIEE